MTVSIIPLILLKNVPSPVKNVLIFVKVLPTIPSALNNFTTSSIISCIPFGIAFIIFIIGDPINLTMSVRYFTIPCAAPTASPAAAARTRPRNFNNIIPNPSFSSLVGSATSPPAAAAFRILSSLSSAVSWFPAMNAMFSSMLVSVSFWSDRTSD